MNESKYFEYNRKLWDDRVESHKNSKFYNVKGFKSGKTSLNAAEISELGDVSGKPCCICNAISGWIPFL